MKLSVRMVVILVLEGVALGTGAYLLSFLNYHERSHVVIGTGILCVVAGIAGMLVTRTKRHPMLYYGTLVFGGVMLCIGLWCRFALHYHERAAIPFGIGVVCLLSGLAGILIARSVISVFVGVITFGVVLTLLGTYFLTALDYHGRAYVAFGAGGICLVGGLIALLIVRRNVAVCML